MAFSYGCDRLLDHVNASNDDTDKRDITIHVHWSFVRDKLHIYGCVCQHERKRRVNNIDVSNHAPGASDKLYGSNTNVERPSCFIMDFFGRCNVLFDREYSNHNDTNNDQPFIIQFYGSESWNKLYVYHHGDQLEWK
jgi:hypothetical protein